jgi:hypothetical protein
VGVSCPSLPFPSYLKEILEHASPHGGALGLERHKQAGGGGVDQREGEAFAGAGVVVVVVVVM